MIELSEALRLFTVYTGTLLSYHDLVKWWVKFITGQFCRESRLPFSQITVPFTEKRLQRAESGIKDGFEEMQHEFYPEKTGQTGLPFSDVPLLREIFLRSDPGSRVSFTSQPDYQENVCEW